ncbi:hypothetical protein VF21_03577 [Pseudogymnoascus sp. 05NY08]|nr:hypothetical protein VF21_03577 [Pseudogymnoascus sp. 05NY08]
MDVQKSKINHNLKSQSPVSWAWIGAFALSVLASASIYSWTQDKSQPSSLAGYSCNHQYSVELVSLDPLVVYLDDFVSEQEINHLLEASEHRWNQSLVYQNDEEEKGYVSHVNRTLRSSKSAMIPRKDPVAKCLTQRVRSLLGNIQHISIQPIQLVKYAGGERFRMHYDWTPEPMLKSYDPDIPIQPSNRLMSIFVYLSDSCTGGETYFPHIYGASAAADGEKFSRTDSKCGLLVRPRRGSAILWNNMHMNGTGDRRVAHAGLPVTSGTKIGMNLFSVYYLDSPIVGDHVVNHGHEEE